MGKTLFFKKKTAVNSLLDEAKQEGRIASDLSQEVAVQLDMIQLTTEDLKIAKALQPLVKNEIDHIVDRFYKNLEKQGSLMTIINTNSSVDRLKNTLKRHLVELFEGVIDTEFINMRIRIAQMHVKIGLETRWYMCAFQDLQLALFELLEKNFGAKTDLYRGIQTVTKLINFEQQLVLEAYEKENERIRDEFENKQLMVKEGLRHTAENLMVSMDQANASIEELTVQADQILQISQLNSSLSKNTSEKSEEGKIQLEKQNDRMQTINDQVTEISSELQQLEHISKDISLIVGMVTNIADQTNLLALNAAIESARAGEAGKGFSVVANEVRKLAEETKQSVAKVSDLIFTNNGQITKVTNKLEEISKYVEDGITGMQGATGYFNFILEDMKKSQEKSEQMEVEIQEFTSELASISSATQEISASTEDLNDFSKKLI